MSSELSSISRYACIILSYILALSIWVFCKCACVYISISHVLIGEMRKLEQWIVNS